MRKNSSKLVLFSPGTWISVITLGGCGLIALLIVAAARPQIHKQIVMRRAWFNQDLRHYDLAYRDLESLRPTMMDDARWQDRMYAVLTARKDWLRLGLMAQQLHEQGAATPEWLWNGWKAFLRVGWDSKADDLFRVLNEPYILEQLGSGRAELAKAFDLHLAGKESEALESIARARKYGVEPALLVCLESEWLTRMGDWRAAEKLLNANTPQDSQQELARWCLATAGMLLAKGQTISAAGVLDLYLKQKGVVTKETDDFLREAGLKAQKPFDGWASHTLSLWGTERKIVSEASRLPPQWGRASYPPLPEGDIVAQLTPESLIDMKGKPGRRNGLMQVSRLSKRILLKEPGEYTIILRGAANRHEHMGAIVTIELPGQKAGATYFASRTPADRRMTVHLSDGPTTLSLGAALGSGPRSLWNGFWPQELILVRRPTPPSQEDSGFRDFRIFDWRDWISQGKTKGPSKSAGKSGKR